MVEKYDKKYTGREITMNGLFLNFFSGSLTVKGLNILEANDKTVFFSCGRLYTDINLKKLVAGKYEVNHLNLLAPQVNIVQNGNSFNFDDLITKFATGDSSAKQTDTAPLYYRIRNISIDSAVIKYHNVSINSLTELKQLAFSCPQVSSENPESDFHLAFEAGTGGSINTDFSLNLNTLDFRARLNVSQFDLSWYYATLKAFMNVSSLDGYLNSSLKLSGNFNEAGAVAASGTLSLDGLDIRDSTNTTFTSFHQLAIQIDSLNVKQNIFEFHRIFLDEPYFQFELFDNGDNISKMLVSAENTGAIPDSTAMPAADSTAYDYSNMFTLIASYVKDITANYIVSNYSADSIVLRNGHFIYDDYTLDDHFRYDISAINLVSGKINSSNERIKLSAASLLNKNGRLTADFSVTPDFRDMTVTYTLSGIRVSDFNAYSKYYVATPFFDGDLTYESKNEINDGKLNSSNKIFIQHMVAGKKVGNTPIYQLPVRLAVSLLKDVHGNIDLEIPVTGDLNDPEYKVGKVIWQIVTNILLKAATAPIHLIANLFGSDEEAMKEMSFQYGQVDFDKEQYRKMDDIAKVLEVKPEMYVALVQVSDTSIEAEALAIFEAKKKYYFFTNSLVPVDSLSAEEVAAINQVPLKDSLFNQFLNSKLNLTGNDLISTQQKCIQLYGATALTHQQQLMMEQRNASVMKYLSIMKNIPVERIRLSTNHDPSLSSGLVEPRYLINYGVED